MLNLQTYLHAHGIEQLKEELGIKVYAHPSRPIVAFKYSQIDSPRAHPVVKECRGIVLEKDTWKLVAKPFNRFFNVGEFEEEFKEFDWTDFTTVSKEDGSLIIVYDYEGEWHANTSGSFGLGQAPYYDGTWRDLFWATSGIDKRYLTTGITYIFELCTPYNKVVKQYKGSRVYLLGICDTSVENDVYEGRESLVDSFAHFLKVPRPKTYTASSKEEVAAILMDLESQGEIHEGIIIRDATTRWKWKTKKYLALHRLKDNGNIILPKRLVNIVLSGETSEVLAVMPEITSALEEVKLGLAIALGSLTKLWLENKDLESQKDFALAVKQHPMAFILFTLRKKGGTIDKLVYENSDKIADIVFGKRTFEFDVIKVEDG